VPGLSERAAESIIRYREEHGPFESMDDLMHVSGIGEASLERIRQAVQIGQEQDK
jgi:competence protein ComEA